MEILPSSQTPLKFHAKFGFKPPAKQLHTLMVCRKRKEITQEKHFPVPKSFFPGDGSPSFIFSSRSMKRAAGAV